MLKQIQDTEPHAAEDVLKNTEAHELFLKALDADTDDDDVLKLMQDVSKYYSQAVQYGLILKKYYIADINNSDMVEAEQISKTVISEKMPEE